MSQVLTQVKRERDGLRAGNTAARQQRGLVSSEDLLLDFEKRRQNIVATKEQVQQMQAKHAALLRHVAESKRTNRCVHAVGGASGAALTKARRELVRQQHNKEVRTTGVTGCCRHHVKNWRTLVSAK